MKSKKTYIWWLLIALLFIIVVYNVLKYYKWIEGAQSGSTENPIIVNALSNEPVKQIIIKGTPASDRLSISELIFFDNEYKKIEYNTTNKNGNYVENAKGELMDIYKLSNIYDAKSNRDTGKHFTSKETNDTLTITLNPPVRVSAFDITGNTMSLIDTYTLTLKDTAGNEVASTSLRDVPKSVTTVRYWFNPPTKVQPTTIPSTTRPSMTIPPTTIPPMTIPPTTIPPTTRPSTTIPPTTIPPTTSPVITPTPTIKNIVDIDGGVQLSDNFTSYKSKSSTDSLSSPAFY